MATFGVGLCYHLVLVFGHFVLVVVALLLPFGGLCGHCNASAYLWLRFGSCSFGLPRARLVAINSKTSAKKGHPHQRSFWWNQNWKYQTKKPTSHVFVCFCYFEFPGWPFSGFAWRKYGFRIWGALHWKWHERKWKGHDKGNGTTWKEPRKHDWTCGQINWMKWKDNGNRQRLSPKSWNLLYPIP